MKKGYNRQDLPANKLQDISCGFFCVRFARCSISNGFPENISAFDDNVSISMFGLRLHISDLFEANCKVFPEQCVISGRKCPTSVNNGESSTPNKISFSLPTDCGSILSHLNDIETIRMDLLFDDKKSEEVCLGVSSLSVAEYDIFQKSFLSSSSQRVVLPVLNTSAHNNVIGKVALELSFQMETNTPSQLSTQNFLRTNNFSFESSLLVPDELSTVSFEKMEALAMVSVFKNAYGSQLSD